MFLTTLGKFELLDGTHGAPGARLIGPAKPLAMFAYLALTPKRRASRDTLVGLLWSDADTDRARSTLRQSVWSLRQRIGDNSLTADGDDVALTVAVDTDCELFERAVASKDLELAWTLYTGHFIPDFGVLGGAAFEHWADLRRDKLRAAWIAVGDTLARRHLSELRLRDAISISRQLCDECPERVDIWRTRLEALLADGQRLQAQIDADELSKLLEADDIRPDAATRALFNRIRQSPEQAVVTLHGPHRPDLVGREKAFATLLKSWRASASGQGAVCMVRGAAGLGKTRLLHEFGQRLKDMAAVTITVRARPVDRDVPYALVASIAEQLAELPGAAGVASATASVLIELAPTLSNTYPHAERAPYAADELIRLRASALVELLRVVTEEDPVAILVDDLHWADGASRQVLASVCERVNTLATLVVICTRPMRGNYMLPRGATTLDLPTLSAEQLEMLMSSVASADVELLAELGRFMMDVSAGVPLLAVAALDLAIARGWLRIVDERWVRPDIDQLRSHFAHGSVLEELLRGLPESGVPLLIAFALIRRPLDTTVLAAAFDTVDVDTLVGQLEQRGIVVHVGAAWDVAHDTLADAALEVATPEVQRDIAGRLARALLRAPNPSLRTLQLAGRLFVRANDDEAARSFRYWITKSQQRQHWRDPIAAAAQFLGDEGSVPDAQQLARRVPKFARLVNGYPVVAAAIALAMISIGGAAIAVTAQRWLEPAASQILVSEPRTSRGFLWDTTTAIPGEAPVVAQNATPIRVTFRDASGNATRNGPRTVHVSLVESSDGLSLEGSATQPVRNGEATFEDLVIRGAGAFRLQVIAAPLPPARTHRLFAASVGGVDNTAHLTIVSGTINGQHIDSLHRIVHVNAGDELQGTVTYRSLTSALDAAMLMGAVAQWGDRRTNWIVLNPLPPHGEHVVQLPLSEPYSNKRFRAPMVPGTYRIVFFQDAETEMRFMASRTNWMLGTPQWNDGDDIADLDAGALQRLDSAGRTAWPKRLPNPNAKSGSVLKAGVIVGTTLEIVVGRP